MSNNQPNTFEKLLLGKNRNFKSIGDYRRNLLTGLVGILSIISCIIYSLVSPFRENLVRQSIYVVIMVISILCIYLNRTDRNRLSKFILISSLNIAVYLVSSSSLKDTDNYSLYFPLLLLAFALFDFRELKYTIFFASLSLIFFILVFSTHYSILKLYSLPDQLIGLIKALNFTISYVTSVIILTYLVHTSHISENHLILHQNKLNNLTAELKDREQRYELAMTGTNAGIWDWDLKNNRIYHGLRWKEMLGYKIEEDLNMPIDEFITRVHPEDVQKVEKALQEHFDNRIPYTIEYRIRKKDNTYEWYFDAGKAIWDESGNPVRMVGSIINITKRKENEQQIREQNVLLEKANAELDRFVYITSHDLKAPLLSILGLINLAELSENKAEVDLCLKMMKDRIKGLESFISDIIDFSRNVQRGLVKEKVDLNRMVSGIINEFLYMKNADKIHFEVSINPDLNLFTDAKRLTIIMKNLISNAINYHNYDQANPEIVVRAYSDGNNVMISVKDNGDGIAPDIQPRIFDMFYRGTEKSNGSGLGLYIVHEMLDKLKGSIRLISLPVKGAEFIITLPSGFSMDG